MNQDIVVNNDLDKDGKPAGGSVEGNGISIRWQKGPLGKVGSPERLPANGAFVEGVISAAQQRIQWYQDNGYACNENAHAIEHLRDANLVLNARTQRREKQGVEGTHEGN